MVKRTRAVSVASTSQAESVPSTSSNADLEYTNEDAHSRPATRRRTNNTRSKLASSTSDLSVPQSADIASPTPSSSLADDPKTARKQQRKERNRISAQHSRDRKKFESQELRGRLEEAETRVSALAADNERLREENSRFKLELEKSSSLQGELSSLKERFEMLERLLLAGSQQPVPSATAPVSLATPSALPQLSQSPISAPVQADSRIGSETHALAVPFNDELGQLQRNDGIETGQGESAGYEQSQSQYAGEYNEQSSTSIIDYSSLDDLLYNNSNGDLAISATPFSTAPDSQDSLLTTFEDFLSNSSDIMSSDQSIVTSGQATLSSAAPTEATGPLAAATSSATSSGPLGQSQDYHDDDDRFYVKQQEDLNNLLMSASKQNRNDSIDYLGSYLTQSAQPHEDLSKSTNPFFFGISLDTLMGSNTFSSSVAV